MSAADQPGAPAVGGGETPRVDAMIAASYDQHRAKGYDDFQHYFYGCGEIADFARSLERQLAEEKKLSTAISRDCNATALERNDLRTALQAALAENEGLREKEAISAAEIDEFNAGWEAFRSGVAFSDLEVMQTDMNLIGWAWAAFQPQRFAPAAAGEKHG